MQLLNVPGILVENTIINSRHLEREVTVDFFLPTNVKEPASMSLLLINDGQNMDELGFSQILSDLYAGKVISPLFCAAIHMGKDRMKEYGIASEADYLGRGAKAGLYTFFIMQELLPYIRETYKVDSFAEHAITGFSLGGLSALDIAWAHPELFNKVGVFSGSLWWRSMDQSNKKYNDDLHRLMHQMIRSGSYHPNQKFFFQTGCLDESSDRNKNGIIDSIDDTLDLIKDLVAKGYETGTDITYLELADGRHDIPTWGKAMPQFLKWGWGLEEMKSERSES